MYHTTNKVDDTSLLAAVHAAILWSQTSNMWIDPSKSKDKLILVANEIPYVPHIMIDGYGIERVTSCTLLGITVNENA